ncbi:MAG: CHAT domain-containing protein [Synergistaceae bacterium]|jgi:CHAT domain-containing protein/tetratricopeptide (TPR) repeat protein|nr:CHAT domain-containing protein [Synergistaceae bacterium]
MAVKIKFFVVLTLCFALLSVGTAWGAETADALFNKAIAAYQAGKLADAADAFGQAGQAYEKGKNNLKAAQCFYNQGLCLNAGARAEPAAEAFERAVPLYQKTGDAAGECSARFSAAQIHMAAARWDKAEEHFTRGLKIAKTPLLLGVAQDGMGRIQRERGALDAAEKSFKSAEKSFKDNLSSRLRVKLQLAYIVGLQGNISEALKIYDAAAADAAALQKNEKTRAEGNRLVFYALSDKGTLLLTTGWFAEAQKILAEALTAGEKLETPYAPEILSARNNYAETFMYLGDFDKAESELSELLTAAAGAKNEILTLELNAEFGVLNRMRGRYEQALDFFQIFRSRAEKAGLGQRLAQAYIQLGNLYGHTGVWNEAAAHYQEAFSAALRVRDMDSTLLAMQGIYAGDIRSELGLVGKVDYRSAQGLPWRAALTARDLKGRKTEDAGFLAAWEKVDSLRREIFAPIPSLDGFRLIREMAFRGAPEVRHYYQEAKTAWDVGDAALRRATGRLRTVRNTAKALLELSARAGEAAERQYVQRAFSISLSLLRALAGEETLSAPKGGVFIQIGGIFVEAAAPEDPAEAAKLGTLEADLRTLSRMVPLLSLKPAESDRLQKALTAGEPLPGPMKDRLRKVLFSQALKANPSPEELKKIFLKILETTHPSLKKEAGNLASEGGKLYAYAQNKLKKQQAQLEEDAEELLPQTSEYLLLTLGAGEDVLACLDAWRDVRRRVLVLRELGVSLKTNKNWEAFLAQFGEAVTKGKSAFKSSFALTPEKADEAAVNKLRGLAEKLALLELREESENIAGLLAAEGKVSHDDRLALLELQSRVFYALSDPAKAEESAKKLLTLVTGPGVQPSETEVQPDMQWRAYALLAQAAEDRKDYGKAQELYAAALFQLAKIHPVEGTTSQSASDRVALYDGAIRSAFALWRENPSAEAAEKIWNILEGMKGRQWREMLATTGGEFLNALPPEVRAQVRELEMRRVALEGAYRRARFVGQREMMAQVNADMKNLREKRAELTQGLAVNVDAIPGTAAARALLPQDWALADYYLSSSLSFAILLKKESEPQIIPIDVDYDSLFGYAYWMRSTEQNRMEYDEVKFPGQGRPRVTACGLSPEDVGNALFQPIAAECAGLKKLLIIPHDILYVLPFEAMQRTDKDDKAVYLVRDWIFAELPSAFLLTRQAGRKTGPNDEKSLLLLANPAYAKLFQQGGKAWSGFSGDWRSAVKRSPELRATLEKHVKGTPLSQLIASDASPEAQKEFRAILEAVWEEILTETEKAAKWASVVKEDFARFMAPLPGSQVEADILAKLWEEKGASAPVLLLAGQASEQVFWDSSPARFRYVHIACHGYDRGSIPDLQPGLALSPVLDLRNDSFLQMGELSTVRWDAELITLSACETGLGDLYVGDGMFGLSTVLLTGGAKGSVLTRWRASDASAPVFMQKMYSAILDGASPVEALHAAQLFLLEESEFKAPQNWAIFKYVGVPW